MPWPIVVRLTRRQPKRSGAQLFERRQTLKIAICQLPEMFELRRRQRAQRLQPRQQGAFDAGGFNGCPLIDGEDKTQQGAVFAAAGIIQPRGVAPRVSAQPGQQPARGFILQQTLQSPQPAA